MRRAINLFLLFAFSLLCCDHLNAQNYSDSLRSILAHLSDDTSRFKAGNKFGEDIFNDVPDSSLAIWMNLNKEISALIDTIDQSAKRPLQIIQAGIINNIGFYYSDRGIPKPALEYNYQSFEIRERIGDKHGVAESQNNIAFLYVNQHDTAKALEFFQKSAIGYREINDTTGWAYVMINCGLIETERGNLVDARNHLMEAKKLLYHHKGEERAYASAIAGLGAISLKRDDISEAISLTREAIAIRSGFTDHRGEALTFIQLSRCYVKLNKPDSAMFYAQRAYDVSVQYRYFVSASSSAKLISEIYERQGNTKEAFRYYRQYVAYGDSVSTERALKDVLTYQLSYEYAKAHAADSVRNADAQRMMDLEIAAQNERYDAEHTRQYFLIGGIVFLLIFAAVLFNRFRIIRKQKRLIEIQKKLVDEKQKDIIDSMEYATRIQNALLAGSNLLSSRFRDHFVFYRPRDIVSGDFYWAAAREGSGKFYFAVCDSTGHGVPGAFMSLLNMSFLNEAVSEKRISATGRIFDHVRERLYNALSNDGGEEGRADGMDGIICAFDRELNAMEYSCAYNPLLILRKGNGGTELIESSIDKMPVGRHEGEETGFTTNSIQLRKDDLVILFTDGYADQFGGEKGKRLMYKRMKEILLSVADKNCKEIEEHLSNSFDTWKGNHDQVDDVLVVGLRI